MTNTRHKIVRKKVVTPQERVNDALDAFRDAVLEAFADTCMSAPAENYMPFGDFVRHQREGLGMTLQDLADKAGCTKSHIWEIEAGKSRNPTVKMVNGLARGLGVPVMSIFSAALIHASED